MNFTFLLPAPKYESLFPIYDSPFSILCSRFPTPHMHSLLPCSYCLSASLPIISCTIGPNIPYFPCSLFITPYLLPSDHPFPHSLFPTPSPLFFFPSSFYSISCGLICSPLTTLPLLLSTPSSSLSHFYLFFFLYPLSLFPSVPSLSLFVYFFPMFPSILSPSISLFSFPFQLLKKQKFIRKLSKWLYSSFPVIPLDQWVFSLALDLTDPTSIIQTFQTYFAIGLRNPIASDLLLASQCLHFLCFPFYP